MARELKSPRVIIPLRLINENTMSNLSSRTFKISGCLLFGLSLLGLSGCGGPAVPSGQEVTQENWNKRLTPEQMQEMQKNSPKGGPPAAAAKP